MTSSIVATHTKTTQTKPEKFVDTKTPAHKQKAAPTNATRVFAVLPAFNAEQTIRQTHEAIPHNYVDQVLIVDDASHDETVAVARSLEDVIVVTHSKNRGYGGNQKTCYTEALKRGADVVVMVHPDFQYDPSYIPELIKPIINNQADFVIGSRFLHQDPRESGMHWWRFLGNRFLTRLQNKILGISLSECHSGYRAYSRQFLETIPFMEFSDDFVFDSQVIAAAAWLKFRIAETPIPTSYTNKSSSISFPRSVRYGLTTLTTVLPHNKKRLTHPCSMCQGTSRMYISGTHRPQDYFTDNTYQIAAGADKPRLPMYKCQTCQHGFTPIKNISNLIDDWYKNSQLDDVFLSEEKGRRRSAQAILDQLEKLSIPTKNVLEIGSGPGLLLSEASKRDWQTTGIEPSKQATQYAQHTLQLQDIRHGNHHLLSKVATNSFAVVCLLDVLEHVANPAALMNEIHRVLAPEGICVITTPRLDSFVAKTMGRYWYCIFPAHLNYFSRQSLAALLTNSKLKLVKEKSHTRYFSLGYIWQRFIKLGGGQPSASQPNTKTYFPIKVGDEFEVYARKSN